MKKKKIALLIATKNRANSIDYYLKEKLEEYYRYEMDVVIYDSSDDDDTSQVIDKYSQYNNLFYHKYTDLPDDLYGTYKTMVALNSLSDTYEYVWLCGDQIIINYEMIYDRLTECMNKGYSLIHLYRKKDSEESGEIVDETELFANHFWSMTHWCASVISSELIQKMTPYMLDYHKKGYVTVYCYAIYAALVDANMRLYYLNLDFFTISPLRSLSLSWTKKDLLNGWMKANYMGFINLPDKYNPYKNEAIKGMQKHVPLMTWGGIIRVRATDNIDIKRFFEHYDEIAYFAKAPMWWIEFISIVPKWIAYLITFVSEHTKAFIKHLIRRNSS